MTDGTFDVWIGAPVALGRVPEPGQEARTGWIELGAGLEEARALAQRVIRQRGSAYVVPAAYRDPRVTTERATEIAQRRRAELIEAGRRLEELDRPEDGLVWWTFHVGDLDALAEERMPGTVRIAVDKLDGTLRTEQQYQAWLRLTLPTAGQDSDEEQEGSNA